MSGLLLHTPSDVIQSLLIARSLGTTPSPNARWPVYSQGESDKPDDAIFVTDTQGIDLGRVMVSGERTEQYGFQIIVRSGEPEAGFKKAHAIAVALDRDVYNQTVQVVGVNDTASYLVHSVNRKGNVIPMGKEPSSRRSLFSINATTTVRKL